MVWADGRVRCRGRGVLEHDEELRLDDEQLGPGVVHDRMSDLVAHHGVDVVHVRVEVLRRAAGFIPPKAGPRPHFPPTPPGTTR